MKIKKESLDQRNNMYPSRYSNGKTVSAAQYITELICEHKATMEKLDLHYRFWTNKEWSKYYRDQIATANKLLKKYSAKAIIRALNDKRAERIYSLRAPHLLAIIDHHETLLGSENTELKENIDRSEKKTFRHKTNTKQGILSKLKELDDGNNS
jgi:hypothetical protein